MTSPAQAHQPLLLPSLALQDELDLSPRQVHHPVSLSTTSFVLTLVLAIKVAPLVAVSPPVTSSDEPRDPPRPPPSGVLIRHLRQTAPTLARVIVRRIAAW